MVKTYKELKNGVTDNVAPIIELQKDEVEIIDRTIYIMQHPEFEIGKPKSFQYKIGDKIIPVNNGIAKVNKQERDQLIEHGFYYITEFKAV